MSMESTTKIGTLTFTDKSPELLSVSVALRAYLDQFSREQLIEADPSSCIANCRRTLNRITNLRHGCAVEYRVDRNWWE